MPSAVPLISSMEASLGAAVPIPTWPKLTNGIISKKNKKNLMAMF
jgi:hypothetical protein